MEIIVNGKDPEKKKEGEGNPGTPGDSFQNDQENPEDQENREKKESLRGKGEVEMAPEESNRISEEYGNEGQPKYSDHLRPDRTQAPLSP